MKTLINTAVQKSINTLDKLRVLELQVIENFCSERQIESISNRVDKAYDRVAEVAKRQGFEKLTGHEFNSKTEVDVDTINDLLKGIK